MSQVSGISEIRDARKAQSWQKQNVGRSQRTSGASDRGRTASKSRRACYFETKDGRVESEALNLERALQGKSCVNHSHLERTTGFAEILKSGR